MMLHRPSSRRQSIHTVALLFADSFQSVPHLPKTFHELTAQMLPFGSRSTRRAASCYNRCMDLAAAKRTLERYRDLYIAAYIFGSVARNQSDRHSDIDLILVRETNLPFFDRMREVMDLRLELGNADMLIYTPGELAAMLGEPGRYFVKQAVQSGYRVEGKQSRSDPLASTG